MSLGGLPRSYDQVLHRAKAVADLDLLVLQLLAPDARPCCTASWLPASSSRMARKRFAYIS
jgi:hypothetical protein